MSLTTRKQLRRDLCSIDFGEIIYGTATSGDLGYLIDTDKLKSSILSPDRLQNSWIATTTGDANEGKERRIASHLNSTGRVTFDNSLPEAVATGDEYEIHDILAPSQWNKVINEGLSRCTRKETFSVTIVEGQTWYDLRETEPRLELADDVLCVSKRRGTTANQWIDVELPGYAWKVEDDGDHLWLKLKNPITPDATNGLVLRVEAILSYPALDSDSATTSCPPSWARAAAVVAAFELYGRTMESGARGAVKIDQQQAAVDFTDQTVRYAPQYDRSIQVDW